MADLSILQKAACEACWRGLQERDCDLTGQFLSKNTPDEIARARIVSYVTFLPLSVLPNLVLPEVTKFGGLRGGYASRWAEVPSVTLAYGARQAQLQRQRDDLRVSKIPAWPVVSDSSGSRSKDPSAGGFDEADTPKAKAAPERHNRAEDQYFDPEAIASSVEAWQTGAAREVIDGRAPESKK